MGAPEVEAFLSDLAVRRNVSASTQNQALAALLFLYKQVLKQELPWLGEVVRAKKPARLPVVLSIDEVQRILARLEGEVGLVARLLYGGGMRLMEAVRLRVKDVDFSRNEITIRDGKGQKDRGGEGRRLSACCPFSQIPTGALGMGLAVCVPGLRSFRRPSQPSGASASFR